MCKAWNVPVPTYQDRQRRGWSLQESLEGRGGHTHRSYNKYGEGFKGLDGKVFNNKKEFADYYNLPISKVNSRLKLGWTIEEVVYGKEKSSLEVEFEGKKYTNTRCLYEAYNIPSYIYYSRLKSGWSMEDTLKTPAKVNARNKNKEVKVDHLGRIYPTMGDMAKAYGLTLGCFSRRIQMGWSLEKSLTTPVDTSKHGEEVVDPYGNKFPMLKDMLKKYNVKGSSYYQRVRNGYSLEECLGIIPLLNHSIKNYKVGNAMIVKPLYFRSGKKISEPVNCFVVRRGDVESLMTKKEVLEMVRRELKIS